jgi:DNA-binding GntR family transcriptional regulator
MALLPDSARDFNVAPLAPIHPRYLRDQAFLSLREAIVSGRLAPGDPLVIDTLAETFGLSAMPVREAVKRLVADGLVEELPRRAHRIAPLTRQTALDVLGVMKVLMVGAYELGVPRLDAAGISAMRAALERAAAHAAAGELIEALAGIHAMHEVVYAATGNAELGRVLSAITPRFDRVLHLWYTESIVDVGTSYRADLVAALERGERAEAVEIMRRAWQRFREIVAARADEAGA